MRAAVILLTIGMSVAACDSVNTTTPTITTEPATEIEKTIPTLVADTVIYSASSGLDKLNVPEYLSASVEDDVVTLSGQDTLSDTRGETSGASIRLSKELEQSVSEKSVTISIVGRSTSDDATKLKVAYSTNEVGNSGWKTLTFSEEFTVQSFTYDVPKLSKGKGDFVGMSPASGPIEISQIGISMASE